ncbi:MAG: PAS domain S-box protein [Chloroflexi bacterium]|nr:PAS domain S-box protein [Chloroflexota bacterium]
MYTVLLSQAALTANHLKRRVAALVKRLDTRQPKRLAAKRDVAWVGPRAEKFTESLINSSVDGILAFDVDCRYTLWNPGMERITGVKSSVVIGKCAFEVFPFLKETGEDNYFYEALSGKTVVAKDRPFIVPQTGQDGFFEGYYSPLCDSRGKVIGASAVIHDITERCRIEKELRESESKYRMLVEQASDGIAIYDRQGMIVEANSQVCAMVRYTRDELLRLNVTDVIAPHNLATTPLRWESLSSGESVIGERVLLCKDGSLLPVELSARMLSDGRVQTIVRDITVRKKADEAIRLLNEELEERVSTRTAELETAIHKLEVEIAERERVEAELAELLSREQASRSIAEEAVHARDELLSIVSHDLKNPLAAIKGNTQLLQKRAGTGHGTENQAKLLRRIDEAATKMLLLVDELMDFGRLQGGQQLSLQLRSTDLVELVRQVVDDQQQRTNIHKIIFEPSLPELVGLFDVPRLERVITNLLTNAIKYSPAVGEIKVEVAQVTDVRGARARISVRDQGLGIGAEELPHIFEWFRRAGEHSGRISGAGIGLANARQVIEQHGGSISVESIEGKGSTFTIELAITAPSSERNDAQH